MSLDHFRVSQYELEKLRSAWEETPQSKGGIVNLRGFHYQLTTALKQLIRNWSEKSEEERARPWTGLLVEALSDWATLDGDCVIACQVKLTQSSGAVRGALTEFWLIDHIASETVPELHSRLKFRVVSQHATLKDTRAAIARWKPTDEVLEEDLSVFLRKVSAIIEPDPDIEILAMLANRFHSVDPLEKLSVWLGRLIRGSNSERGFDEALLTIWSELQSLEVHERLSQPLGYFWTDRDRAPNSLAQGPVLIGQRPTVRHLRNGYFANRDHIYGRLAAEIEAWFVSPVERTIPKIRMFWIGGRSGTGKTVALLHVLARLYEHGNGTVIWLEDKLHLLPEIIRSFRPLLRESRDVIIGIDDPYNPLNQADTDSALTALDTELMTLRQDTLSASMPHIVCCGPVEQRVRLKKDYSSIVDLSFADLPLETPAELQNIWTWFCNRTGTTTPMPYRDDADVLLVQLFFEWRTGQSIADFAARFRKRIRGMDQHGSLEEFVSRMLALNRLYTGYPTAALKELRRQPAFDAALRRLETEEHHLTIEQFGTMSGLRLAHPHLANALYDAWYDPVEDEPYRRAHLRAGLEDALSYNTEPRDRLAPLWAIARSQTRIGRNEFGPRISAATLNSLLPETYDRLREAFDNDLPAWMIPIWIELQIRFPDLPFRPSPIEQALRLVDRKAVDDKGFPLTCRKLLQHSHELTADQQESIYQSIHSVLLEFRSWREWAAVATHYLLTTRRRDLGPALRSWISKNLRHHDAASLLQAALATGADVELLSPTCKWLEGASPEHPTWSFVWQDLFRLFPTYPAVSRIGRTWLDRVDPKHASWGHVWQDLNRTSPRDNDLLERGMRWLREAGPADGSWAFVWQDLRRAIPTSADLIELALTWLDNEDPNNGSWTFVWEELWKATPDDVQLIERGRRWLERSDKRQPSWTFMWQDLWSVQPGAEYMVDLGVEWLDQIDASDAAWSFVWSDLSHRPDILVQRLCDRLAVKNAQSKDWARLWLNAYELKLPTEQLTQLGKTWLSETPPLSPAWHEVWTAIRKLTPKDPDLVDIARPWLHSVEPNTAGWGQVWSALRQRPDYSDDLSERAEQWLKSAYPNGKSWGLVWESVRAAWPDRNDILTLGRKWLNENELSAEYWELVWAGLCRSNISDPDLMQQGVEWLDYASVRHPSWPLIWMLLAKRRGDADELQDLGRSWLENGDRRSVWFGFILGAIQEAAPEDTRISAIGTEWLDESDPQKGYWGKNWETFQAEYADDEELRRRATRWLRRGETNARFWGFAWSALRKVWPRAAEFLDIGFEWLMQVEIENASWLHVWLTLQSIGPAEPRLRDSARRFLLTAQPEHPAWVFMFARIWEMLPRNETHQKAEELLRATTNNRLWATVWLARSEDDFLTKEFLELGRKWLIDTPFNGSGWRYVWEIVYRSYGDDEDLFTLGKSYLSSPYAKRNEPWRKLWGSLFKARPKDEDLFRIGVDWLETTDSRIPQWRETLQVLITRRSSDERLFAVGLSCLSSPNMNSRLYAWNQLWQAMIKSRPHDPLLIMLAKERLRESNRPPDWGQLWHSVFKLDPLDRELFQLGESYVREHEALSDEGALILVGLCKAEPENTDLRDFALKILADKTRKVGWYNLWSALANIAPTDPELLPLGLTELRAVPQSGFWNALWTKLNTLYPDHDELRAVGLDWLRPLSKGDGWSSIWLALYDATYQTKVLLDLGKQWLEESSRNSTGWVNVWKTLFVALAYDPKLTYLGRDWITQAPLSSREWAIVWTAMYEAEGSDELLAKGVSWLDQKKYGSSQWAEVWKICWIALKDDHLAQLAFEWLHDLSRAEWANVWLLLSSVERNQAALIDKAFEWLSAPVSHGYSSRRSVFAELRRLCPNDESVLFI